MPELPEAETIVRGLREFLPGRTVEGVTVHHADVVEGSPARLRRSLRGRTVRSVDRRGKKVVLRLDDGGVLLVYLGMTGRLIPTGPLPGAGFLPTHPAVRFRLAGGGAVVFDDVRRFGRVALLSEGAWRERSQAMGPEPLSRSLTAARLAGELARSRSPVRSWLLDQRRIAGVGNIYANEALWYAGIHPGRPAREVCEDDARRLLSGLRRILNRAIRARGTTLRDYRTADGGRGGFGPTLAVYGREGSPCRRCSTPIERLLLSNRSAFHCPGCQRD